MVFLRRAGAHKGLRERREGEGESATRRGEEHRPGRSAAERLRAHVEGSRRRAEPLGRDAPLEQLAPGSAEGPGAPVSPGRGGGSRG